MLQAQTGMGWTMTNKYLDNVPTPDNFNSHESSLDQNAIYNEYATSSERKNKKKEEAIKSYDINHIIDRISQFKGDISKLEPSERLWMEKNYPSDD